MTPKFPPDLKGFEDLEESQQIELSVAYFPAVHAAIGHWDPDHLWDFLDAEFFMKALAPRIKTSALTPQDKSGIFDEAELSSLLSFNAIYGIKAELNPSMGEAINFLHAQGIKPTKEDIEGEVSDLISNLSEDAKAKLFDYFLDSHVYQEDSSYAFLVTKAIARSSPAVYQFYAYCCLIYVYGDLANKGNSIEEMITWIECNQSIISMDPLLDNTRQKF